MNLWPHQQFAIEEARQRIGEGHKAIVVSALTVRDFHAAGCRRPCHNLPPTDGVDLATCSHSLSLY
jgi:hypothetical protein